MNGQAGRGNVLMVPLHFESRDDLSFIFDTGAPFTLFDSSLTEMLGPQHGSETIISMYGKSPSHYYIEPPIYWGDVRLRTGHRILTWDLGRVSKDLTAHTHSDHQVMGILGMDCLWHYCIQLDFVAQKIRFLTPSQAHRADLGKAFALAPDRQGCPTVVGVRDWRCMIDTGCIGKSATNVLGLDFLARHLVTFDFPNKQMYLKEVTDNLPANEPSNARSNKVPRLTTSENSGRSGF